MRNEHIVSVFSDLKKTYDKTWKYGIMRDLYNMGLRGNLPLYVHQFLSNRKFWVKVNNHLSNSFLQKEGVPQRAILSVTLFTIEIN